MKDQHPASPASQPKRRLIHLEGPGRLLVCTDLHGNLADFLRIKAIFEQSCQQGPTHLLFTGDLIHGPNYLEVSWPDYLGEFYVDQSGELVEAAIELKRAHPHCVHFLLGNHEHSHIGGPHTPKFWADETKYLEHVIGPERTRRFQAFFRGFSLVVTTSAGVTVTHAAPNVEIACPGELEAIDYSGHEGLAIESIEKMPTLGRLIWSRSCPAEVVAAFLAVLSSSDRQQQYVAVYGHDVAEDGYRRAGPRQLVLSSSFGVKRRCKVYLQLDLSAAYHSSDDLRYGQELRPLYDEETTH